MRAKNLIIFLIFVVATSIFLNLVGNQRPSIQTIVTETHKQLNNLKNFKVMQGGFFTFFNVYRVII
jgi:hypothetical protein